MIHHSNCLSTTYRRLTLKSVGFKSGFPRATSCSLASSSFANRSRSCDAAVSQALGEAESITAAVSPYLFFSLLCSLALNLVELSHEFGSFVLLIVAGEAKSSAQDPKRRTLQALPLISTAIIGRSVRIRIYVPRLLQYSSPFDFEILACVPSTRVSILQLPLRTDGRLL